MIPWKHQTSIANEGYKILQKYAILYLAMEERTGKSFTALLVTEAAAVIKVLIVTKKKALPGWEELLGKAELHKCYTLTTYTQIHKLTDTDHDLVILDEAHNYISSFPKLPEMVKKLSPITRDKPIIYISATPHAQTPSQLYHQLYLSSWSTWGHSGFKAWHRVYGIPYTKYISGRQIEMYDRVEVERTLASVEHLFITKTRKELDFEFEPVDELHYVHLDIDTKEHYNSLMLDKIHTVNGIEIACDTPGKLRPALHMLEGGTAKATVPGLNTRGEPVLKALYLVLDNNEKVDYIKDHWGDTEDMVIMYNYIAERDKLEQHFANAQILQATSNAEGVDLSNYETLIVYSQDFSTARHTQRRARQANKNRTTPIVVHFLLVKDGLSDEVYTTVSLNKQNYVDYLFERNKL